MANNTNYLPFIAICWYQMLIELQFLMAIEKQLDGLVGAKRLPASHRPHQTTPRLMEAEGSCLHEANIVEQLKHFKQFKKELGITLGPW